MRILLADLAHTYSTDDVSLIVPLGLGYIKAYALARQGETISIDLYKHPERLLKAAANTRPTLIGLANYGWNENLNKAIGTFLRDQYPEVILVAGGPNIDPDPVQRAAFLRKHDYLDFIIVDGGEESFSELIDWCRSIDRDLNDLPMNMVRLDGDRIVATPERAMSKQIVGIESPYLGGHLDEFLEAGMAPMFESNRGCPFKCTFCAWGSASKDLVRRFDLDMTLAEIEYVGARAKARAWILCDANFGILKRDVEIARAIRNVHDEAGYPQQCHIWLAKNVTDRNLEIGEILGDMTVPVMAVQSLAKEVLKAIKRENISTDTYVKFQQKFHNIGSRTYSDLIVPLPGETLASHLSALRKLISFGVDIVMSHNMRLLAGAETNSGETRETYDFRTRYRLIHGDSGAYEAPDGTVLRCFEYEESLRSTSTLSEAEMFFLRKLHFLVDFAWNTEVYKPLLGVLLDGGAQPIDILIRIVRLAEEDPKSLGERGAEITQFFNAFDAASRDEWFDSPEEIEAYFEKPENFGKLIAQEFEKLNVQFSIKLFQECKDAFDATMLFLARRETDVSDQVIKEAARYAFALFPAIGSPSAPVSITLKGEALRFLVDDANRPEMANGLAEVRVYEGARRREMSDRIAALRGKNLSKVLDTQGYALRDLRCNVDVTMGQA